MTAAAHELIRSPRAHVLSAFCAAAAFTGHDLSWVWAFGGYGLGMTGCFAALLNHRPIRR